MQLIKTAANKFSRISGGLLCGGMLMFYLAGCAQLSQLDLGLGNELSPHDASQAGEASASPAVLMDLKSIIRLIEAGQSDAAKRALKTYLSKDPKNSVALSLQQQLTVNPVAYLGKPVESYTVQSGDTLRSIAAKFLGNSLKFVILGRYNQISRVKDLRVGQVLKLPVKLKADASAVAEPDVQPVLVTEPAALSTPTSTVPEQNAKEALAKLSPTQKARVQTYHEAALVAYRKQDLDNAIALWNKALAIDPDYEPALGYRARAQELQRSLNQMDAH